MNLSTKLQMGRIIRFENNKLELAFDSKLFFLSELLSQNTLGYLKDQFEKSYSISIDLCFRETSEAEADKFKTLQETLDLKKQNEIDSLKREIENDNRLKLIFTELRGEIASFEKIKS